MSTTTSQSSQGAFPPAQGDNQRYSTAQAHEQGPSPGTPPNEHPPDPKPRPNDAHSAPTPETAKRNAGTGAGTGTGGEGSDPLNGEYPPQKHAGKAGLGPHYYEQHRATFQDKVHGLREEIEGQIKHDEKLRQVRLISSWSKGYTGF
jgi:hypothetical protein